MRTIYIVRLSASILWNVSQFVPETLKRDFLKRDIAAGDMSDGIYIARDGLYLYIFFFRYNTIVK